MNGYTVYMHVVPNGKKYVGITTVEPKKRWNRGSGYSSNEEFYEDIRKYGWDNIEHLIVKDGLNQGDAEAMERELIARYNTTNPKYGYNFSRGGGHGGISNRLRKKLKDRANPHNAAPCMCVETGKKYKSIADAAEATNISSTSIRMSCASNGQKTIVGRHFVYLDKSKIEEATRQQVLRESHNWGWDW